MMLKELKFHSTKRKTRLCRYQVSSKLLQLLLRKEKSSLVEISQLRQQVSIQTKIHIQVSTTLNSDSMRCLFMVRRRKNHRLQKNSQLLQKIRKQLRRKLRKLKSHLKQYYLLLTQCRLHLQNKLRIKMKKLLSHLKAIHRFQKVKRKQIRSKRNLMQMSLSNQRKKKDQFSRQEWSHLKSIRALKLKSQRSHLLKM